MASRDIVNNLAFVQLQAVGNAATSPPSAAKSKVLDTMGFEAAMVLVNLGTVAGVDANNYVQIVLQESNTTKDADFTNVSPTANSLAGVPSASADFGDMNAPIGSVYPQGLLPAGMVTLPALYTGSAPINATTMARGIGLRSPRTFGTRES